MSRQEFRLNMPSGPLQGISVPMLVRLRWLGGCLSFKHPVWPIRSGTDSIFRCQPASLFLFFSFPIIKLFAGAKDTCVRNTDAMRR